MNKIENIGVVGSGTMGNGIAHVFSLSKFKVTLVDLDKSILDRQLVQSQKIWKDRLKET